jgi:hypothetical protein
MDEADARLVGPDNRFSDLAFGLQLLEAAFYRAQLMSQSRSVFRLADRDFRSQFFALLLELKLLRIPGRRDRAAPLRGLDPSVSISCCCFSMPVCKRVIAA